MHKQYTYHASWRRPRLSQCQWKEGSERNNTGVFHDCCLVEVLVSPRELIGAVAFASLMERKTSIYIPISGVHAYMVVRIDLVSAAQRLIDGMDHHLS